MNGPPNQYHGPPMGPGGPQGFPPNMPPGQGNDQYKKVNHEPMNNFNF